MKKNILYIILFLLFCGELFAEKAQKLSLMLTSNLEGKFSLEIDGQEKSDPLLLLGQSILRERKNSNAGLYLDLGNSFYPGLLSKYSFGSVMMDFFESFKCSASLLSSRDIRIGIDNLMFHQDRKKTLLLSSNIVKDKKIVFAPYFLYKDKDSEIAFIGISSRKILFDVAEKNVYEISLEEENRALEKTILELKEKNIRSIVLLSGLSNERNISILKNFRDIKLIICGGDNSGDFFGEKAERFKLADGRTILFLSKRGGYYIVDLYIKDYISVRRMKFSPLEYVKTENEKYNEFLNRLTLWKKKFIEDEGKPIYSAGERGYTLDNERLSLFLRGLYDAEISIMGKNTIKKSLLKGNISPISINNLILDDYVLYTYKLSGNDLVKIYKDNKEGLIISGFDGKRVQGYPVNEKRYYRVVSTQRIFESLQERLDREFTYKNTWQDLQEIIMTDLKNNKGLLKDNFDYIDNSFRATIDFFLSAFIDKTKIDKGENIPPPPGQSTHTYRKWGIESKVDFTLYNRYHQFIITPYIFFTEEEIEGEKNYLQNLLRGTFLYNINLDFLLKPYFKSQCDTVVKDEEGLRPTIVRETLGPYITSTYVEGKVGVGFEKQVHDPSDDPVYGLESIIKLKFEFLNYFTFMSSFDSFLSKKDINGNISHIRTETVNALSFAFNSFLSLTLKHRWMYLYSDIYDENYKNSQMILSLDVITDFKIF